MRISTPLGLAFALLAVTGAAQAQKPAATPSPAVVTPVINQLLPEYPGKEAAVVTVDYAPGGQSPLHHHDAYAFVYVLEGSVEMAVQGGELVTLSAGQAWNEKPGDVHTISRNASKTKPAKFVVFFLKDANKPAVIPGP